jgi:hypothetical protein
MRCYKSCIVNTFLLKNEYDHYGDMNGVSCLVRWTEHAERSGNQAAGKYDMLIP